MTSGNYKPASVNIRRFAKEKQVNWKEFFRWVAGTSKPHLLVSQPRHINFQAGLIFETVLLAVSYIFVFDDIPHS